MEGDMKNGFVVGVLIGFALALMVIGYGVGRYQGAREKPDYDVKVLNEAMFLYLNNRTGTAWLCRVDGKCIQKFKTN